MEFGFVLLLLVFVLFLLNVWRRTAVLERDMQTLREELRALRRGQPPSAAASAAAPEPNAYSSWKPGERPWSQGPDAPPATPEAAHAGVPPEDAPWEDDSAASHGGGKAALPPATPQPAKGDFEFNFGQKLPVWIGGIALAFAGFYLVKYSIDVGLLTHGVRVILGLIFGISMIGAGTYIRTKNPTMADGTRIAQALTGAGLADLYATIFAATTLFHLIYPPVGFLCMAIVTAMAVVLSIRHGKPIAVLGLLGGFLTPVLIQTGHPNAAMLFSYLFMLVIGFFSVITMLAWWALAIPVLLLAFLWVPVWLFTGYFHPEDGIVLSLFLLACGAIAVFAGGRSSQSKNPVDAEWGKNLGYVAVAGCITLMAVVTGYSKFALEDWALYGLLGAGCIAMARFRPAEYGAAPWLAMISSLVMLAVWEHADDKTYALILLGFALLYNIGGLMLLRFRPTLKAAGLLSASALSYFGLAYMRLHEPLYDILGIVKTETLHLWGIMAIALAGVFTLLTAHFMRLFKGDDSLRQQIMAVTVLTATAFLSVALTIEVRHEFLPVAFAAEILAVCWVNLKVDIKALRQVAGILFGIFVLLMGEQLLMLCAVVINSLSGVTLDIWHGHLPLAEDPMFQLGLPMAMIGLSSYLLQRRHDGRLVETFEIAAVGLGALLMYYLTRNIFKMPDGVLFRPPGFFERGIITNLFFAAGLAVVYGGRLFSRRALVWSGTALFAMAMFRVVWFDFITQNPLVTGKEVGQTFLFNSLMLPYLFPCFWLWLEDRPQLRLVTMSPVVRGAMTLILAFTYISLNVRQSFHGSVLAGGVTTNAEIYAYSAVWLVLGGFLLFFGTARKDKPMRRASLALIVLTVCKVFLYDASNLAGLYRVFSFMGLGLSLLALSWFYSRFVFKDEK